MKLISNLLVATFLLTVGSVSGRAEVKLPALFGDHMVLQRDASVPVWGTAAPNEAVTVTAGSVTASTKADQDGKWIVHLDRLPLSSTPIELDVSGTNKIVLHDVLVGDVWVCSGQSNMQFTLDRASTAKTEIPAANHPDIRIFIVKATAPFKPQSDCVGKWVLCTPDTAKGFSAVGYFFGQEIAATEKIPVGLIGSYVGGTPAQSWTSLDTLQSDPDLKKAYGDPFAQMAADPGALKPAHDAWLANGGGAYRDALKKFYEDDWAAQKKGEPPPPRPAPYTVPEPPYEGQTTLPTVLFNGMIAPLEPFAIKGVVWYQGESNGGNPLYAKLFPAMIADWRKGWGQGDFPFIYVQLPNFGARSPNPAEIGGWPLSREDQLNGLAIPNTGMAITIDAGDGKNLHPPYKDIVGHRLALCARHLVYGEDLVYSGPLFDSFKIDGNKVIITFKNVGTGLKIGTPPITPPGGTPPPQDQLKGFAIAGSDHKYSWAKATISGPNTVTVTCDQVTAPASVLYGWDADPEVNLYNSADLPASPFRTDAPAPPALGTAMTTATPPPSAPAH
jgi:sialate O-acetylesterase